MKNTMTIAAAVIVAVVLVSCGGSAKDKKGDVNDKKVELEKLKKEQASLTTKIGDLEKEIAKLYPSADLAKAKLVAVQTIGSDSFDHFIDLQGKIDAQNIAMVAPQGQGGVVRAVLVKQGQRVSKGQLVLKLDDALARQSVVAAQQQTGQLKTRLAQAETVYERYQNLWKQNIGAEIQVINAKADVDAIAAQLKAANAQVALYQEQANMQNVYAGISGTVDVVNVRVGEFFSPATAGMPNSGIRIVNTGEMKVVVQVPENYLDKVKVGSRLQVTLPEVNNKVINTKVTATGSIIDPVSRTFFVEAKIAQDASIKPNQIAKVQILDYSNNAAITIPVNILQTDEKGKYVLVAVEENGKLRVRKKAVMVGELYGAKLEVKSGLVAGDKIITEGFESLYDGQLITTDAK